MRKEGGGMEVASSQGERSGRVEGSGRVCGEGGIVEVEARDM